MLLCIFTNFQSQILINKIGAATSTLSAATSSSSLSSSVAEGDSDAAEALDKDGKKKKNRCATCRKKVGLTGMSPSNLGLSGGRASIALQLS